MDNYIAIGLWAFTIYWVWSDNKNDRNNESLLHVEKYGCPHCNSEYQSHIEVCADCNEELLNYLIEDGLLTTWYENGQPQVIQDNINLTEENHQEIITWGIFLNAYLGRGIQAYLCKPNGEITIISRPRLRARTLIL